MRTFANLFLFFFLIDGSLSVLDDALILTSGIELISPLRNLNAIATLLLAFALFIALGLDRRLLKRIFLPLLAFLIWTTAGCWPLGGTLAREQLQLMASLLQLLLGGMTFLYLRYRGGSFQFRPEDFSGRPFSLMHTLTYFAGSLLVLPFLFVFLTLATVSQQVATQTAGYMRVSPLGLYMKERVYAQKGKEVRLTGMIHIGEQEYYRDLAATIDSRHTIVLAEGVSDELGLLNHRFDYNLVGSALGLSSQEEMLIEAQRVEVDDLGGDDWSEQSFDIPHIARADVDLSAFEPRTVEFLNVLGRLLTGDGEFGEKFADYNSWVEKNMTPEVFDTIMVDIVEKRNHTLIGHLEQALPYYDTIVVPWGAMHMPAIEQALLGKGFMMVDERERLSLDFRSLPYRELAGRLAPQGPGNP